MPSSAIPRDERIDLRLSAPLKALLTRAASYGGVSLPSFLVMAATERARAVVAEHETATLSTRDWEAFLAVLDDDRPTPKLAAAVRRYRARRAGLPT